MRRQRHLQEQLKTKQAMLLSKPAEVKKLADLIILGQKVGDLRNAIICNQLYYVCDALYLFFNSCSSTHLLLFVGL